jgi:hypothetical protein
MLNKKRVNWDKEEFFHYMISTKKITPKVARDYISRCDRLVHNFGVQLDISTKNKDNFLDTVDYLHHQIIKLNVPISTQRSLSGTLRLALRTYGEYKWGTKIKSSYPRLYLNFQSNN